MAEINIKTINNASYPQTPTRHEFTMPLDATVADLRKKVIDLTKGKYNDSMFQLQYKLNFLLNDPSALLSTIVDTTATTNPVWIERTAEFAQDRFNSLFAVDVPGSTSAGPGPRPTSSTTSNITSVASSITSVRSSDYWDKKSTTGYAGLSNQGATCYLNSLIQTLFMSPEFRDSIFKWDFDQWARRVFEEKLAEETKKVAEGATDITESTLSIDERYEIFRDKMEEDSIPRQLQKLFVNLLKSDRRAESTSNLTKSFGWNKSESFTQHDVQELCRVLFEALENVWQGTDQRNLINELYQGEMKDYVQCLNCGHESARVDKYLDIPLVIKAFGSTTAVKSIEEGLLQFVEVETLDGDNKYNCENCNGKHDALKGLKFKSFPYLLALQLKRFDFNYETMKRIKLHDHVTFPEVLDMNQFLETGAASLSQSLKKKSILQQHNIGDDSDEEESKERSKEKADEKADKEDGDNEDETEKQEDKEKIVKQEEEYQFKIDQALKNGPAVYELYSILVHRGSSMGGHYYAYIKSFNNGKWYCFNDSSVSVATRRDLEEAYGGKPTGKMAAFQSTASAYMLMYRQYDPLRNIVEPSADDLPESLKTIFEKEEKKEKEKEEERKKKMQMVSCKILHNSETIAIDVHKEKTFQTVVDEAVKAFKLEELAAKGCLRLREYQSYYGIPQRPLDGEALEKTLAKLCFPTMKHLIVELKEEHEEWEPWSMNHMTVRISVYSDDTLSWSPFHNIAVTRDCSLAGLKEKLENKFAIPFEKQVLVKEDNFREKGVALSNDLSELRAEKIFDGCKLWLETAEENELPKAFQEVVRLKNEIEVQFNSPDHPDVLHKMIVSKLDTLLDLKKQLSEVINLDLDSFKVFKGQITYKVELRNEADTLKQLLFSNQQKLVIEKGQPLRNGEMNIKFFTFDPNAEKQVEPLFHLPLPAMMTVAEAKEAVVAHFNKRQEDPETKHKDESYSIGEPSSFRLREIRGVAPHRIYLDTNTVKDLCQGLIYTAPEILLQKIVPGETEEKTSKSTIVIFLQQFFPSTWTLGKRFEFSTDDSEKLTSFRDRISERTGINNLGFVSCHMWEGPEYLSLPKLKWNIPAKDESVDTVETPTSYIHTLKGTVKSLYLTDGELMLFKDTDEELKELTQEEKEERKKWDEKKKTALHSRWSSYRGPEAKLVIKDHSKDVTI